MAASPCIKGAAFAGRVEAVGNLLASGKVSRMQATRWLKPEDLAVLNEKIVLSKWYDLGTYVRLTELLRDVEGGGQTSYLRELGRQTAKRLLDLGLYQQLEYLSRTQVAQASDPRARFDAFGRDLKLLTTLSASIFNFTKWTSKPDTATQGRYVIEVSDARDYPELLCWTSDGFVNGMATQHGERDLWSWKRAAPDLVVFSMLRSV